MSITKIGSTAFKGLLTIQHETGTNCFDAKNINKFVLNSKVRGVYIEGDEVSGKHTRIHIPYYAISQDKVLAAYKAARIMNKGNVILKIDNKCLVKSR